MFIESNNFIIYSFIFYITRISVLIWKLNLTMPVKKLSKLINNHKKIHFYF